MIGPWRAPIIDYERPRVRQDADVLVYASEERYNRITRLATRVLSVPIAVVSVDDAHRGRRRSSIGLTDESAAHEEAVLSHLVDDYEAGDLFLVEDALTDKRLGGPTSHVGDLSIRSYAGHVLRLGGHAVGALLVMDFEPRVFSNVEVAALVDLAFWAEAELRSEAEHRIARDLDDLQRRTEMVLASVAQGVVGVDCDGLVTFVNPAAETVLRWSADELVGGDLHALTHSRRADGSPFPVNECAVTEVLASGRSQRLLHGAFWRHDGTPVRVDWSAGAVYDDAEVVGAVIVFDDASRRVEVEQMKQDFIAVVSHELRTPLTSLKGAVDLLSNGVTVEVPAEMQSLLDIARRNAERLARLVDDVLDVERSDRSSFTVLRKEVDVAQLMAGAMATVQGSAEERGIRLDMRPLQATVWGDEHRLLQVLTNLLGNAMRFSHAGGRVSLLAESDRWAVRLVVRDEGVGIPQESLGLVFDRFWQVDASDRRSRGGSGLGLAIAKNIVEAHGGWIVVDSELEAGSAFTVCLPLRAQHIPVAVDRRRQVGPAT